MAHITSDIFERLESGDKQTVEDVKQTLREHFGRGKDQYQITALTSHCLLSICFG